MDEMLCALEGTPHRCEFDGIKTVLAENGRYFAAPVTHHVTLGEIVGLLEAFRAQPATLTMPEIPCGSFAKKLYSTYLSYLPKGKVSFPLKMNVDPRGSFTELLRTEKMRTIFREHFSTRYHQGPALAPHKMGVFHRGCRQGLDPDEKDRHR